MAISYFDTPRGWCGFDYLWNWIDNGTFFGVGIEQSITRKGICAFNKMISTILYIRTWKCTPPYYYFNSTTESCQDQCGLYHYET